MRSKHPIVTIAKDEWTEADWLDLHDTIRALQDRIAARHGLIPATVAGDRGAASPAAGQAARVRAARTGHEDRPAAVPSMPNDAAKIDADATAAGAPADGSPWTRKR